MFFVTVYTLVQLFLPTHLIVSEMQVFWVNLYAFVQHSILLILHQLFNLYE